MELVLATLRLADPGGSETYAITIAGQLERLGHDVTLYAQEHGAVADYARKAGLRVRQHEHELPEQVDAVIVQDAVLSYELAARYDGVPQVFVAHTADFDLQRPPQVAGVAVATVALNDRVGRGLEALGGLPPLVRLRQPVDVRRFVDRGPLPERPVRALVFSKYLSPDRVRLVQRAAAASGIEASTVGGERITLTPETEIGAADIVIGSGRSVLEAMASGRAVYVLGRAGGDGWVTRKRYEALESDGFAGLAFGDPIDGDRLQRDFAAYSADMGRVNRELVVQHHHASDHAVELAHLLERVTAAAKPTPRGPLRELARMVRVQWATDVRAMDLAHEVSRLQGALKAAEWEAADARRHGANIQAWGDSLQAELDRVKGSRRYRAVAILGTSVEALRRIRRRGR